jgi:hypothetical protein
MPEFLVKNGAHRLTFDGQEWFLTAEVLYFFKKQKIGKNWLCFQ